MSVFMHGRRDGQGRLRARIPRAAPFDDEVDRKADELLSVLWV